MTKHQEDSLYALYVLTLPYSLEKSSMDIKKRIVIDLTVVEKDKDIRESRKSVSPSGK